MNYYPYYFASPVYMNNPSVFSSFFNRGGLSLSSLLNGAQRTLGLVNQALPIIKEAAPMMKNARTMFRVMNEFKKIESPVPRDTEKKVVSNNNHVINDAGPTFFA